jgi:hypothetical protein
MGAAQFFDGESRISLSVASGVVAGGEVEGRHICPGQQYVEMK